MKKTKKLTERIEKKKTTLSDLQSEWSGKPRQVERVVVPSASPDEELFPYLDNFLSDVKTIGPMPDSDISTPEGARAAVHMLSEKLEQLEKYRKTAVALKSLLSNQVRDDQVQQE